MVHVLRVSPLKQIRNYFRTKNNYRLLLGDLTKITKTEEIGISRQTSVSKLRNINGLMVSFSVKGMVFSQEDEYMIQRMNMKLKA